MIPIDSVTISVKRYDELTLAERSLAERNREEFSCLLSYIVNLAELRVDGIAINEAMTKAGYTIIYTSVGGQYETKCGNGKKIINLSSRTL